LGILFKKEREKEKRKKRENNKKRERGQMSHSEIKRDLAAQVLLKFFKFSKRGI
jgi:hypothetical protein